MCRTLDLLLIFGPSNTHIPETPDDHTVLGISREVLLLCCDLYTNKNYKGHPWFDMSHEASLKRPIGHTLQTTFVSRHKQKPQTEAPNANLVASHRHNSSEPPCGRCHLVLGIPENIICRHGGAIIASELIIMSIRIWFAAPLTGSFPRNIDIDQGSLGSD